MSDDEPDKETVSVKDLLKGLRDGQQEICVQFARLNGTVEELQRRSTSHSGKLGDLAKVQSVHSTRLAVVEQVTVLRDEHQAQGIRNATGDAWEARVVAGDAVGWFRQAAVTAVMVLLLLLLVGGVLVAFG